MTAKFVISSLEEDLQELGLLPKSSSAERPSAGLTESAESETATPLESSDSEAAEAEAEVAEGVRLLRLRRPNAKIRKQRRRARLLRRRNRNKRRIAARRFRKSAKGRQFARRYKRALQRFHGHAPKNRRISLRNGLDRVADMVEDVQGIVRDLESAAQQDVVKGFANLALIGNQLAEQFGVACEAGLEVVNEGDESLDFCGMASHYEALAEDAADVATSLHATLAEGVELDITPEEITEDFQDQMADVLEGLELLDLLTSDDDAVDASEEGSPRPTK